MVVDPLLIPSGSSSFLLLFDIVHVIYTAAPVTFSCYVFIAFWFVFFFNTYIRFFSLQILEQHWFMFTAFKRDLLVIRNTNPTVPQLKRPVFISGMHGQVLKAESHNFYIPNHFFRFFSITMTISKFSCLKFQPFSSDSSDCKKKKCICAAVHVIDVCVTAQQIYVPHYPHGTQPQRPAHTNSLLAVKVLAWLLRFHMQPP